MFKNIRTIVPNLMRVAHLRNLHNVKTSVKPAVKTSVETMVTKKEFNILKKDFDVANMRLLYSCIVSSCVVGYTLGGIFIYSDHKEPHLKL